MKQIVETMNKARDYIRSKTECVPEVGIVLGTGLGALAEEIEADVVIPYTEIPGFMTSTVEFHQGSLILGKLSGKNVIAMQGRFHLYEGYSIQEITFPIRVIKAIGASILIISNAAGGMNPDYKKGDLVLIRDHINFMGVNPLAGVYEDELGPRFPDMSEPYSRRLLNLARDAARGKDILLRDGVYVAVAGPSLETAAEYRFLRIIGADMVGMSTVPEDIVAVQMGMEVFGITIISDLCDPDNLEPADINGIIATCEQVEPQMTTVVKEIIKKL